jgi:hypothetical protein
VATCCRLRRRERRTALSAVICVAVDFIYGTAE